MHDTSCTRKRKKIVNWTSKERGGSVKTEQARTGEVKKAIFDRTSFLNDPHSIIFGIFFDAIPQVDCTVSQAILIRYYSYFFYPILCGFCPILISGSVSILAYRNVRRIIRRQLPIIRRRLDRQLTKFVLTRVIFLIIFNIPFVIYRIYAINVIINPNDSMGLAIERLIQAIIGSIFNLNFAVKSYFYILEKF